MSALLLASTLIAAPAFPKDADKSAGAGAAAASDEQPIFGRDLMTQEELMQHRARMRTARTPEEREALRRAHHATMLQRAREQGIELPEQPPPRGRGIGMGRGPGAPTDAPVGAPPPDEAPPK